jgi:hypothetical protein
LASFWHPKHFKCLNRHWITEFNSNAPYFSPLLGVDVAHLVGMFVINAQPFGYGIPDGFQGAYAIIVIEAAGWPQASQADGAWDARAPYLRSTDIGHCHPSLVSHPASTFPPMLAGVEAGYGADWDDDHFWILGSMRSTRAFSGQPWRHTGFHVIFNLANFPASVRDACHGTPTDHRSPSYHRQLLRADQYGGSVSHQPGYGGNVG